MSFPTNKRLSAHDSLFLYWERPEQPMHLGECMVYDGEITRAEVRQLLEERLHLLPRYQQRVIGTPFGIAHPTWVEDPNFNLDDHIFECRIPEPGDEQALSKKTGEIWSELLPRDRPLWNVTIMHGYFEGTVLLIKLHHSMVDGVSSVELIDLLHTPTDSLRPATQERPKARKLPSAPRRFGDAIVDNVVLALDNTKEVVQSARPSGLPQHLQRVKTWAFTLKDVLVEMATPLERTPFNATIGVRRDFAWCEFDFDEITAIRRALGGTVNDVVLAILAGGLGRYMRRHGFDTSGKELVAMCPVSVRKADESGTFGNLISMVWVPLYVDENDGAARLKAENNAMEDLKRRDQASGMFEFIQGMKWVPAPAFWAMWKLWPKNYFPLHITSTNVPGPREVLYLGEHECLHWYPFGVQWTNAGLFLCTLSYRGRLILGPVSAPDVVDDVWDFATDLEESFREIKAAAEARDVRLIPTEKKPRRTRRPTAAKPRQATPLQTRLQESR